MYTYKDCYALFDSGTLTIGNALVERTLAAAPEGFAPLSAQDKANGRLWQRDEGVCRIALPFAAETVECSFSVCDNAGLSEKFLRADLVWKNSSGQRLTRSFSVFPQIPFIAMHLSVQGVSRFECAQESAVSQGIETALGVKAGPA